MGVRTDLACGSLLCVKQQAGCYQPCPANTAPAGNRCSHTCALIAKTAPDKQLQAAAAAVMLKELMSACAAKQSATSPLSQGDLPKKNFCNVHM